MCGWGMAMRRDTASVELGASASGGGGEVAEGGVLPEGAARRLRNWEKTEREVGGVGDDRADVDNDWEWERGRCGFDDGTRDAARGRKVANLEAEE